MFGNEKEKRKLYLRNWNGWGKVVKSMFVNMNVCEVTSTRWWWCNVEYFEMSFPKHMEN